MRPIPDCGIKYGAINPALDALQVKSGLSPLNLHHMPDHVVVQGMLSILLQVFLMLAKQQSVLFVRRVRMLRPTPYDC